MSVTNGLQVFDMGNFYVDKEKLKSSTKAVFKISFVNDNLLGQRREACVQDVLLPLVAERAIDRIRAHPARGGAAGRRSHPLGLCSWRSGTWLDCA